MIVLTIASTVSPVTRGAEPVRLAAAGLLEERREPAGRRRRTYSLTDACLAALRRWLRAPTGEPPQIRDLAVLKL